MGMLREFVISGVVNSRIRGNLEFVNSGGAVEICEAKNKVGRRNAELERNSAGFVFLGCGFGRRDVGGRLQGEGRVVDSDVGEGKIGVAEGWEEGGRGEESGSFRGCEWEGERSQVGWRRVGEVDDF